VMSVIQQRINVIPLLDVVLLILIVEQILALFAPITIVLLILVVVLRMLNVVLAKFAILPTYVNKSLLPVAVLKIQIVEPVLVALLRAMVPNIVLPLINAVYRVSLLPLVKFAKNVMVLPINVKVLWDVVLSMPIALVVKSVPISLVLLILLSIVVLMMLTVILLLNNWVIPLVLISVQPKEYVKLLAVLVSITLV